MRARFIIPTLEQCEAYARSNRVQGWMARDFFAYYQAKGWQKNKKPVIFWREELDRWIASERKRLRETGALR